MFFGFDLVQAIQIIGYPGIFAIILAESGLFFAVTLPGGSLLFTAGLLASQGYLNIYILLSTVLVAAILGDTIGYWFGAWVGPALYRREDSRFFKKKHLEQTRAFFDRHGSKAVLLGRFVPVIRTFVPILAGVVQMRYHTFLAYNVIGACIWAGGFTLGGYFLGESVPNIENYIEYIVLGIVFVTMIPLFLHVWRERRANGYTGTMKEFPTPLLAPDVRIERESVCGIIFDLDDTLAESFQPPSDEVLEKVFTLAERMPVAIMSGATFARLERDVMKRLPAHRDAQLFVFSDNAARCDLWRNGAWITEYHQPLEESEREQIKNIVAAVVREANVFIGEDPHYRIIDRGTSVSFAALEDGASKTKKSTWDPDMKKRVALAEALRAKLPGYEILIAGKTTIDIVRKGISKAYGVEWLSAHLETPAKDMLFIGDAFYEGGNDAMVIPTGIQIHHTSGPEETEKLIDDLLKD